MNLIVGERLPGSDPAQQPGGYVVSALVAETAYSRLYAGKKIFYNFDFSNERLRETDEAEWLDVFLRTIRYPYLDDPAYVAERRTLARGEVRRILGGRTSNLWPEPIDLLEVANTRDVFTFPSDHDPEPVVVFARPQGLSLAAWQQTVVPVAAILGVLAELLEFVRQAHAEGLLLGGLGPAAVLVDGGGRAHYVGTDTVIDGAHTDMLPQARARLFPPERFPRGYTPPEVFEAGTVPDTRADLYAWAALAYFLLTGQNAEDIAREQGKPWAHFQAVHFARLKESLRAVPPLHVQDWAEELGVPAATLAGGWPDNLAQLFRALLHPDPSRRPASVPELLGWIDAPPPVPPQAALALITGPGESHVFLDWGGFAHGLDMMIRRGVGQAPLAPTDGTLLEQGPMRASVADADVPLTLAPVYYTVFARRNDPAGPIYSPGTSIELEETSPAACLRLANREAAQDGGAMPPRLALLFAVHDKVSLIEAWSRSDVAVVRSWALTELEQLVRADPDGAKTGELLRQYLRDPLPAHSRRAAEVLLRQPQTDDALLGMARFAGGGDLDGCLGALDMLVSAGLDQPTAGRLRDVLEEERPTACPECRLHLPRRERAGHLQKQHGYVDVAGSLVPLVQALAWLWERTLGSGEVSSHERILQLVAAAPQGSARAYLASFEEALARRAQRSERTAAGENGWSPTETFQPYLTCLLQTARVDELLAEMLRSSGEPARDVARAGWLALLRRKARSTNVTGKWLRRELEQTGTTLEEQILLCLRLPEAGIEPGAARLCLGLLEVDRLVNCPECGTRVPQGAVESHLRRAHGILQFRGVRRSFSETRDAVLAAACAAADGTAWQVLEELAHDQYEGEADAHLVTWVCHHVEALNQESRAVALATLADTLAQGPGGARLLSRLVDPMEPAAHQHLARELALALGARLAPPADAALDLLEPLVADRQLPPNQRQDAVIGLLRTTGKSGAAAERLLEAYVANTGKMRAIDKLHELEQRIGQADALDVLCARLEDQVRMSCPMCAVELVRKDMVAHVWDHHRLVLDGRRVREPWRVLDDWVVDYGLEKDAVLLNRCLELASKLDPEEGVRVLQRKLLTHGIEDLPAQADLSRRAGQHHAALCPYCFGEVPMPGMAPPLSVLFERDGLAGAGFHVAIQEDGIVPIVAIETPTELIRLREQGLRLTRTGALAGVALFALVFFVMAELCSGFALSVMVALLLALGLGMLLGGFVLLSWPGGPLATDRLLNAAWRNLAPELVEDPTAEGLMFFGGLADISLRGGEVKGRADIVEMACEKVSSLARLERAGETGTKFVLAGTHAEARGSDYQSVLLSTLTALVRLAVADSLDRGDDPLPLVAEQVGECLRGLLPLSHAALVLEEFFGPEAPRWTTGMLARLQVLLCGEAFAAGLELADLVEVCKMEPILAGALKVTDLQRLAELRQLWDLRDARPWERFSRATSIFDMAANARAGEKHLTRNPGVLLQVRGHDIALGSRGIWYQDVCWKEMPERVEIVDRRIYQDEGFDLVAGPQTLYFDDHPRGIATLLEAWLTYYFTEFLPSAAVWQERPASASGKRLRDSNALTCQECRRVLLGRLGEVGVKIE